MVVRRRATYFIREELRREESPGKPLSKNARKGNESEIQKVKTAL